MAYMNQEIKTRLVANLKKNFPTKKGWKFSCSVNNFTRLGTVTEWALCLTSVIICQLAICETNKGCK